MTKRVLSSDRLPHKSLQDIPFKYQFNAGTIHSFYLPRKGLESGDSFILQEDETGLTMLLQDMVGHGVSAQKRATFIEVLLQEAVTMFSNNPYEIQKVLLHIEELLINTASNDCPNPMSSLALVHIQPDQHTLYCLPGDSPVIIVSDNKIIRPKFSTRPGLLQVLSNPTPRIYSRQLKSKDRIFMGCDGVFEYDEEKTPEEHMNFVCNSLQNQPLAKVLSTINKEVNRNKQRPLSDDYTALCLELH